MRRLFTFFSLLLLSTISFAQQSTTFKIIGRVPNTESTKLYQLQVGAFKIEQNAETAFGNLSAASLNPVYEKYLDFTRVMIRGIGAKDIASCLEKLRALGFNEIIIREDTGAAIPISTVVLPAASLTEIAYRTIRIGETKSIADLAERKTVKYWISSVPSIVKVNSPGSITGLAIGNAFIRINETEYITIAVVPEEDFYALSDSQISLLPSSSKAAEDSTKSLTEYRTEPTYRLAYRFNNKGENRGASGRNGGIDILGMGKNYNWLWTTYYQGGWFYDLNGKKREMVNGYQKDAANGVELTVKPEFIYDQGVSYLQLRHLLHNTNSTAVSGQRFGASADVMIHENDEASLTHTSYGAHMTDSETSPSLELMFISESGNGITPVDTLWLGTWGDGAHLDYIYDDRRTDVKSVDSAIGFSYQDINLQAGETKEFIVRFTLARKED
ncbi:hypothetical protein AGMMS50293_14300 [Spirochaetia bacterium]|nr:hypothetical protein AGMMS50293_14300 [Spirochaetia bacterium]